MNLLKSTPEDQKRLLRSAVNIHDLAKVLEVEVKVIRYYLFKVEPSKNYLSFELKKKSGGVRVIRAPSSSVKLLQSKIRQLLENVYRPRSCVKGFVKGQNIVTNAQAHIRCRMLLNIDLVDFFPSINFGRVRGVLMAKPYSLHKDVATLISQICCYDNSLPQGSPASPILANIVCSRLDSELLRLAKRFKCKYTRYADDISFSTTRKIFSPKMVRFELEDGVEVTEIGPELNQAIKNNGFEINDSKIRVKSRGRRQEVTGVVINESPNVDRRFIRQIRAIIHAIMKFGPEKAERIHHDEFYRKEKRLEDKPPLRFILEGKLGYLKMVKGESDPVYRKLVNNVRVAYGEPILFVNNPFKDLSSSLWILESEEECHQGSGFYLRGWGVVTCAHVLAHDLKMFRAESFNRKYDVKVLHKDDDLDVAVLAVPDGFWSSLEEGDDSQVNIGDPITLSGFPNYRFGDKPYVTGGRVAATRIISLHRWLLINTPIIAGNSGGAVLDGNGKVVGIAATGTDRMEESSRTEDHGVIPISALKCFLPKS